MILAELILAEFSLTQPGIQERSLMRNRIFGAIGVLWGAGILASGLLRGGPEGAGAYGAGQMAGLVFGLLLLVAGGYSLLKGSARKA
jgi:hypothetical protein